MALARFGAFSVVMAAALFGGGCSTDHEADAAVPDAGNCEDWGAGLTSCDAEGLSCEETHQLAQDWIQGFTACTEDADCHIVHPAECLPWLCGVAISVDADLDEIESAAQHLQAQAERTCDGCAIADCAQLSAKCESDKCTTVVVQ